MIKKQHDRICPNCNNIIHYTRLKTKIRADRMGYKCRKCSSKLVDRSNFGESNGMWKGIGEMPYRYLTDIQNHAKQNARQCDISLEDLYSQYKKQNGKCIYSGIPLIFVRRGRTYRKGNASIDRIDSSEGYTKNNIQWVHKDINRMKTNFTNEYFIKLCNIVSENMNTKEKLKELITSPKWQFDPNKNQTENFKSFLELQKEIKQLDSIVDDNDYTGNLNHSTLPDLPVINK